MNLRRYENNSAVVKNMLKIYNGDAKKVIELYEQRIIKLEIPEFSLAFCEYVPGADLKAHGDIIYNTNDMDLYLFFIKLFKNSSGCKRFKDAIKNTNDIDLLRKLMDCKVASISDFNYYYNLLIKRGDKVSFDHFRDLALKHNFYCETFIKDAIDIINKFDNIDEADCENIVSFIARAFKNPKYATSDNAFIYSSVIAKLGKWPDVIVDYAKKYEGADLDLLLNSLISVKAEKALIEFAKIEKIADGDLVFILDYFAKHSKYKEMVLLMSAVSKNTNLNDNKKRVIIYFQDYVLSFAPIECWLLMLDLIDRSCIDVNKIFDAIKNFGDPKANYNAVVKYGSPDFGGHLNAILNAENSPEKATYALMMFERLKEKTESIIFDSYNYSALVDFTIKHDNSIGNVSGTLGYLGIITARGFRGTPDEASILKIHELEDYYSNHADNEHLKRDVEAYMLHLEDPFHH